MNEKGEVFCNTIAAGEPLLGASAFFVPTPQQTRATILRIRRRLRISRAQLAVALGVGKDTLRSWETGDRTPCTAARRLVQLTAAIFFSEEALMSGFGAMMIGQIDLKALETTRQALLPASARSFLERFRRMRAARQAERSAA